MDFWKIGKALKYKMTIFFLVLLKSNLKIILYIIIKSCRKNFISHQHLYSLLRFCAQVK